MYIWRIACKKPDGTPYIVRFRATDAQMARQVAMADGHTVELGVQPELIPEPIENVRLREPGEVGAIISIVLAITGIFFPLLALGAVIVGAQAASDSHGKRGWFGFTVGVASIGACQIISNAANR